jgi:hypothetical protein
MSDQGKTDDRRHLWKLFGAMFVAFSAIALLYSTLFPQVMDKYEQHKRSVRCNPQFEALMECNSRNPENTDGFWRGVRTPLDWGSKPQPSVNLACSKQGFAFARCWEGETKQ